MRGHCHRDTHATAGAAPLRPQPAANACSRCEALCCRLTVVVEPADGIPAHLTTRLPEGPTVMARDASGWCVALDPARMNCSIYAQRPEVCRRFVMNGAYCRAVREDDARDRRRAIVLHMTP